MITLFDTGMRINEALSLGPNDVVTRSSVIAIPARLSETRKGRQVPLSKKTARELASLINEVKAQFGEHDRVFVSNAYHLTYAYDYAWVISLLGDNPMQK